MKHQFSKSWLTLISTFILTSHSWAQNSDYVQFSPIIVTSATATMDVNVQAAFSKDFKNATNITWMKLDKSTIVKFLLNNILHRVLYNQKGGQIYHLSYPEAKDLSTDITSLLTNRFKGYSILRGIHVIQDHLDVWIISLENDTKLIFVRIQEDETELAETYDKG